MPTLVTSYSAESGLTENGNTLTTASFTPSNGDVLVVKMTTWDTSGTMDPPTGGGQSFTSRVVYNPGANLAWVAIYTAVVSGSPTNMAVSATHSGSISMHSMLVERWSSASLAATPVTATATATSGTPLGSLTTSAANSAISAVDADWNGASAASRAYLGTSTEEFFYVGPDNGSTGQYFWYQAVSAAGSATFGMSAPSQRWTLAGLEILDSGGGGPTPISLADSGASDESVSESVTSPLVEAGGSSESVTSTVGVGLSDTGPASDSVQHSVTLTVADAGSATEGMQLLAVAALTDVGSSTPTLLTQATVPVAETGSSSETLVVVASTPLADTGSAGDTVVGSSGTAKTLADSALGSESLALSSSLGIADSAQALDALTPAVTVSISDNGLTSESLSFIAPKALNDIAQVIDAIGAITQIPIAEIANSVQSLSALVAVILNDIGSGSETLLGESPAEASHMAFSLGISNSMQDANAGAPQATYTSSSAPNMSSSSAGSSAMEEA